MLPIVTAPADGRLSAIGVFPDGGLLIAHGNTTDTRIDTVVFDYDVVGVSFE